MKKLLLIALSIVSFTVCSQNIAELEKEKTTLDAQRSIIQLLKKNRSREYDSILAIKELDIKKLKLVLVPINKSIDSLKQIMASFGISENNFNMYNLLKKENIIDPTTKKYNSFYKQLKKDFAFSEDQKFLIIQDFICLEKFDATGRLYSFEKKTLTIDQIEKQKKLLSKGSILYLKENDVLLENLTGVNANYLSLLQQMEALNQRLEVIGNDINKIEDLKKQLSLRCEQEKTKLDNDYDQISTSITDINNQITIDNQKVINYSKFKTKNVNGIEICTTPLTVREFRNGDEIKKARTEGEWIKFNELKIPSYHFKDFDDKQGNYGFIYNYYAITDDRDLAPHGFHKLNLLDFNSLEGQSIFPKETKLVDCWCGDGTEGIYESCTNCNYWNESQRKYNVCTKCKNQRNYRRGTKKCSTCNGKKTISQTQSAMADRLFFVFPSTTNKVIIDKPSLTMMRNSYIQNYHLLPDDYTRNFKEQGFPLLICKDHNPIYTDDIASTKVGDIEIMNTYLNVTKFRNGDQIKYIEDPVEWELALKNNIPAYCYFNNINEGKGCIYNIHAWNDKRGLMPINWRSITKNDLINLDVSLNYPFTLTSAHSPVKNPPGVRNTFGEFNFVNYERDYGDVASEYLQHCNFRILKKSNSYVLSTDNLNNKYGSSNTSGYVLCVRDAGTTINLNQSSGIKFDKSSLISNSKLLINDNKGFEVLPKSGDYLGIYNEHGVKLIDNLVLTNFDELFDANGELRIIAMEVSLTCESTTCCGYAEYLYEYSSICGLIIKKSTKTDSKFTCSAIIAGTSAYDLSVDIIQSAPLVRSDELSFTCDVSENQKLNFSFCFSRNKCNPSNNPIDNFYVLVDGESAFGINTEWQKEVEGAHWGSYQESALEQVLDFMKNN